MTPLPPLICCHVLPTPSPSAAPAGGRPCRKMPAGDKVSLQYENQTKPQAVQAEGQELILTSPH